MPGQGCQDTGASTRVKVPLNERVRASRRRVHLRSHRLKAKIGAQSDLALRQGALASSSQYSSCPQKMFGVDRRRGSDAAALFRLEGPYSPNRLPLQYHPVGAVDFVCGRRRVNLGVADHCPETLRQSASNRAARRKLWCDLSSRQTGRGEDRKRRDARQTCCLNRSTASAGRRACDRRNRCRLCHVHFGRRCAASRACSNLEQRLVPAVVICGNFLHKQLGLCPFAAVGSWIGAYVTMTFLHGPPSNPPAPSSHHRCRASRKGLDGTRAFWRARQRGVH